MYCGCCVLCVVFRPNQGPFASHAMPDAHRTPGRGLGADAKRRRKSASGDKRYSDSNVTFVPRQGVPCQLRERLTLVGAQASQL